MSTPTQPTWDDWREKLRDLRSHAGMTQRAMAHAARLSKSTIGALETGIATPKRTHAVALDEALSSMGELTNLWDDVSGRARRIPEWWAKPLEVERRAQEIWEYDPSIIPGLLQTPDYARAIFLSGQPHPVDADQLEEDITIRTTRMEKIPHVHLSFILTERALLSHPPENPEITLGQLDHIEDLVKKAKIRLQILPDEATPLNATFPFRVAVLNPTQSVVYMEYALGGEIRTDAESVAKMVSTFGRLSFECLPSSMSLDWIARKRSQWNGGTPAATATQSEETA